MDKNNKTIKLIAGTTLICVLILGFVYNKILKPGIVVDVCAQEAAQANLVKNESTLKASEVSKPYTREQLEQALAWDLQNNNGKQGIEIKRVMDVFYPPGVKEKMLTDSQVGDKKPSLNETAQRCIKAYLGK